jgi:PiT family inorganic phosphate transporter
MSHKITAMSHGQGFSANLATGILVILASPLGLPVSTTPCFRRRALRDRRDDAAGGLPRHLGHSPVLAANVPMPAVLGGSVYWLLSGAWPAE